MEDYKKKYEKAIERLQNAFYNNNSRMCDEYRKAVIKIIEPIFPELKESEDERIRKELLYYIQQEKNYIESQVKLENSPKLRFLIDAIAWIEKRCEQKPTDKVEPKFKVGDWIVHNKNIKLANSLMLVADKYDNHYLCKYINRQCSYNIEFVDKYYHPWTIQEAKDGDVLYCKSCGIEYIVMCKCINEQGNIDSYFRYNSLNGFGVDIPSVLSARQDDITPATKEQRDLLFQKMKEAGYEWDAEKKELKKIEKKPAWSEEDEKGLVNIIIMLKEGASLRFNKKDITKAVDWLKSLKERMKGE